jgi:hypothetical protein
LFSNLIGGQRAGRQLSAPGARGVPDAASLQQPGVIRQAVAWKTAPAGRCCIGTAIPTRNARAGLTKPNERPVNTTTINARRS